MLIQESKESVNTSISPFPDEVFSAIFEYLSPIDLAKIAQSNRTLYRISSSPYLWEKAYFSFWHEEDFDQADRRQTLPWRNAKRVQNLYKTAKEAWKEYERRDENESSLYDNKKMFIEETEIPFPIYLSSSFANCATLSHLPSSPNFYKLFCERMKIDEEVLWQLKKQCLESKGWYECMIKLVEKYGDDMKDVLQALIVVQKRIGPSGSIYAQTKHNEPEHTTSDFPSALQVRLPSTCRSEGYHLTLLHLAEELLVFLTSRQAMYGMSHLKAAETNQPWKYLFPWQTISAVHPNKSNDKELEQVQLAKEFENSLCFLTMLRGGQGQEISDELDVLAVSCALYLARNDIKKEEDLRKYAVGICKFMTSRGFKGASDASFYNLDNSFIHLCLDESGRESLPLTLVVIFCALANRLGVLALPTNTPARLLAIVNISLKKQGSFEIDDGKTNDCFWISVADDGLLYELNDLQNMLGVRSLQANSSFVSFSTPIECCSRAANNIINSVQRGQAFPTLSPDSNQEQYEVVDEEQRTTTPSTSKGKKDKVDQSYEWSIMGPENVFNPRKTYLHPVDQQEYLTSPFWLKDSRSKRLIKKSDRKQVFYSTSGRFHRVHHWSEFSQWLSIFAAANARVRFGEPINESGLRWLLDLSSNLLPQNVLILYQEFFPNTKQTSRLPDHSKIRTNADMVKTAFDQLIQQDSTPPIPKKRSFLIKTSEEEIMNVNDDQLQNTIYPVGTVFVHRNYRYFAVIRTWDEKCTAGEDWIRSMGVDRLPNGGRNQPFYSSMVSDGSTRYVAHCNILPASINLTSNYKSNQDDAYDLVLAPKQVEKLFQMSKIGSIFRCAIAQSDGRGLRLQLNARGQSEYPDDDELYQNQMNKQNSTS